MKKRSASAVRSRKFLPNSKNDDPYSYQSARGTGRLKKKSTSSKSTLRSMISSKKKKVEPKKKRNVIFKDKRFCSHFRFEDGIGNFGKKLNNVFIQSSRNDQFSFGGKTACTTIAIEAAMFMLFENINLVNVLSWNPRIIDQILKDGCMQDLQIGNQSFSEVSKSNKRFSKKLEVIDHFQDTVNQSFTHSIKRLIKSGENRNSNVAAIITKQPETICLYYQHVYKKGAKNCPKFFVVFDSHPRSTDCQNHGAHVIYFKEEHDLKNYLSNWMFPAVFFEDQSLDELYNTYSFTVIKPRKNSYYEPFLVKDIIENQSPTSTSNNKDHEKFKEENEKLRAENNILREKLKAKDLLLQQRQDQIKSILSKREKEKKEIDKDKKRTEILLNTFIDQINEFRNLNNSKTTNLN